MRAFIEKPGEKKSTLVNAGIYFLEPQALSGIPVGQAASIEREIFPELAAKGRLYGFVQEAYFADIGTPESLIMLQRDIIQGRLQHLS